MYKIKNNPKTVEKEVASIVQASNFPKELQIDLIRTRTLGGGTASSTICSQRKWVHQQEY